MFSRVVYTLYISNVSITSPIYHKVWRVRKLIGDEFKMLRIEINIIICIQKYF
jgi:hypothetical protein